MICAVRAGVLVSFLERRGQRAASRRSSKHARDAVAGTPQAVPKILFGLKQLQSTDDSAAGTVQHVQRAGAVRWARVWVDEGAHGRALASSVRFAAWRCFQKFLRCCGAPFFWQGRGLPPGCRAIAIMIRLPFRAACCEADKCMPHCLRQGLSPCPTGPMVVQSSKR